MHLLKRTGHNDLKYPLDCARDHIRTGRSEHPLNCTGVGASLMTLSSHNPFLLLAVNNLENIMALSEAF